MKLMNYELIQAYTIALTIASLTTKTNDSLNKTCIRTKYKKYEEMKLTMN